MIQYAADILQDNVDYGFLCAHGAHAVVLAELEEGNVTWDEPIKIASIRRNHNQRASFNGKLDQGRITSSSSYNSTSNRIVKPCFLYQQGKCTHSVDHASGKNLLKHICSYCFKEGKYYLHSEPDCKRKIGAVGGRVTGGISSQNSNGT